MAKVSNVHVALLRGINVGGKNILPMKDLVAMFTTFGCAGVRTYIQSGNVVYEAPAALAAEAGAAVEATILKRFGHRVPVVTRTAADLKAVVAGNPFLSAAAGSAADADKLQVAFLGHVPDAAHVASLDPRRSPGDEFIVRGRDIFLRLPNGVGRTKLTNAYFDSKLATTSTVRNWRTVLALLTMTV